MLWLLSCAPDLPDRPPQAARIAWSDQDKLSPGTPQDFAFAGSSVAGLGDVDGDGFGEVAVGAPGSGPTGAVLVTSFGGSALDPTSEVTLSMTGAQDLGRSVAAVGDVNGDGHADLLAGAHSTDSGAGLAVLWLGDPAGLGSGTSLSPSDSAPGQYFGFPVAAAGDLDGDGLDDALVGAVGHGGAALNGGAVYALHGTTTGLGREARYHASDAQDFDSFGYALGHGDLDGDGYQDALIGAPGDDAGGNAAGAVYVLYGSATGLGREQKLMASDAAASDAFGHAVAGVGDADGDGFDEVVVGAYLHDLGAQNAGAAYVYMGSASGAVQASELRLQADDADKWDNFGVAVAGGGDVDGDGYADLVVGAWDDDEAAFNGGAAYVFFGSVTGVQWRTQDKRTAADADDTDYLGKAVAFSPDLDGDGTSELLMGAEGDDDLAEDGGAAHLHYGSCARHWYPDSDGDGAGEDRDTVVSCTAPSGYAPFPGDCAPDDPDIHPLATELPDDGVDQDCDGVEDCWIDADGDGVRAVEPMSSTGLDCSEDWAVDASLDGGDCDDSDAGISPLQTEALDDGVDQDCDGLELCYEDADQDHFHAGETTLGDLDCAEEGVLGLDGEPGDCNDGDPEVNPAASEEIDDALDSDCDGLELCFQDADGDGYRTEETVESDDLDCGDPGEAQWGTPNGDCEDEDETVHPGALDHPGDGIDQDCDGLDATREDTGSPSDTGQVSEPEGCGCGGGGFGGWLGLLAGLLAWLPRRRVGIGG